MLLSVLALVALLVALLAWRVAAVPPFALLSCLFANWADRCRHGPELV